MKGQVSTELLVIVALVLLVFIPLLVIVYLKANDVNQQMASYQAELSVSRLASLANSVGSLGTSTSVTTDVFLPYNTLNLTTATVGTGGEITLTVQTAEGINEISDVIKYPIENPGVLAESTGGWMRIKITSVYSGTQATIKIERA